MSKLVPQETINAFRQFNNLSVDTFGIDCLLFVPSNKVVTEVSDAYTKPEDDAFIVVKTQVFIEWKPEMKRLRKFGIFAEGEIPVIAWFKSTPDVKMGSYIKIDLQYIPKQYDRDEFEVVDITLKGMYDAEILRAYKLVPRRVKSDIQVAP